MSDQAIQCAWCDKQHALDLRVCPSTGLTVRSVAEATPPTHAASELVGRSIDDRYKICRILGEGGMGTVFEAEHEKIGRSVALKVLHPSQARKKSAVRRFHQEARAAAAIGHPNICEVYDFGSLPDGRPYLVMERLVGKTLADRLGAEGGLPFDDTIEILTQVLSGLVAAHDKGIVHRDIKPENVFLTSRVGCPPVVKLLDFGVSKVIGAHRRGEDIDLTRPGMVMGTPHYMAPEQARGERDVDARVDLYACGVMLYEALTGQRPFTAPNYDALLLQIISSKPRAAHELRPTLPRGFETVIDKAMARKREDRYTSAAELQLELRALRDQLPPPPSRSVQPRAPGTRVSATTPPPTSIEIPITFANDTGDSGEIQAAPPAGPYDASPTDVHESPFAGEPGETGSTNSGSEGDDAPAAAPKPGRPPIAAVAPPEDTAADSETTRRMKPRFPERAQ